jgi:O-antigen/teichoic acid export membrane protein
MTSRPLFKALSWLLLLNFLVKPVWIFFIDREVQNQLGHQAYGSYFALFSLSWVLLFVADAGLSNMLNKRMASEGSLPILPFITIKIFLSLLYLATLIFFGWIFQLDQWTLLFYIAAIHLLNSFFIFLRSIITAEQFFSADAWLSVTDKLMVIIFAAGFLYLPLQFGSINLILFLQIQLVSSILAVAIAALYLFRKKLSRPTSGRVAYRPLLRATLPFTILILLMGVHYRIDSFLLERIHPQGAMQTGIYALGFRLLDAGNMIGYLVASFLVPFIARNLKENVLIDQTILQLRHILLAAGISIAAFSWVFSPWIQQLLYHSDMSFHSDVIRFSLLSLPAYFMIHIYGSVLTAASRLRPFILIMLMAVMVNMSLNFILIPAYGALGSCFAALGSQYLAATGCYVLASRTAGIGLYLRSLILYAVGGFMLVSLFYLAKMAIINVWLILAIAVLILLVFLLSQARFIKKHFFSR